MDTYFINLERCTSKRQEIESQFPNAVRIPAIDGRLVTVDSIKPYVVDRTWRDPSWNRRTTKGEVGCILSHIKAWKQCVLLNSPIIILEDDVEIRDPNYIQLTSQYCREYDFLYLGRRHISGPVTKINDLLETPGFCYWCCAYCITPKVAKALLEYFDNNPLIPADEIVPAMLDLHRWPELNQKKGFSSAAFSYDLISPKQGAFEASETEKPTEIWMDFNMYTLTVATDPTKAQLLLNHRPDIINLGDGVVWEGGTMEGPGGGQKINLVKEFLYRPHVNDDDIILFVDGYDTFIQASNDTILERYFSFRKEVVVSTEVTCWPDASIADQFPEPPEYGYKFLNSGTYIGTVRELKKIFAAPIQNHEDDQLYFQKQYLSGQFDIGTDYESYLFFCLSGLEENAVVRGDWVVNTDTNCTTCIVHGNGGSYTKKVLQNLYNQTHSAFSIVGSGTREIEVIHDDMFIIKGFLPVSFCEELIEALDRDNRWHSLPNDEYPAKEIRLNTLADKRFIEAYREAYNKVFVKYAQEFWPKLKMYGIRDLFALKYTLDTQSSLPLHHDMSLVTASIKLNNDYSGGTLQFPRQKVDNTLLEVGDAIVWPGQVTHPHECLPLTRGTKYSLTMWTSRMQEGDVYAA